MKWWQSLDDQGGENLAPIQAASLPQQMLGLSRKAAVGLVQQQAAVVVGGGGWIVRIGQFLGVD
jgi:hypothetical protein